MPRWLRRVLWALGALVLVVATAMVVDLWRIRSDLESGQQQLHHLGALSLDCPGGLASVVGRASGHLHQADRLASDDPGLRLLAPLPFAGHQVASIRRLSAASARLGDIAHRAAVDVQTDLDHQSSDPAGRLALLDAMTSELSRVRAELASVDAGPAHGLLPPLASARSRFVSRVASARTKLDRAYADVALVHTLLAGPGDYVVLAANNAEMRAGAGAPLSAGLAHLAGGDLKLSPFQHTMNLFLSPDRAVPIPPNLTQLFNGYRLGYEWRNMTMSADFPEVAPIIAKMATKANMGTVDGVLVVDAVALKDVFEVVGPVTLDGVTYDASNIEREVLNGDYFRYPNDYDSRASLQGRLASEAFKALNTRHVSAVKLAEALAGAAKGRHVLAWSANPVTEDLWTQVGASGAISDNDFLVAVENVAANKLDWYVNPTFDMRAAKQADGATKVTVDLTLTNPKTGPVPFYVSGNDFGKGLGQYRAMIAWYLPNSAYNVGSAQGFYAVSVDGPTKVAMMEVPIPPGDTKKISVSFLVGSGVNALTVIPSARPRPEQYRFDGVPLDDSVARTVSLTGPLPAAVAPPPAPAPAPSTGRGGAPTSGKPAGTPRTTAPACPAT